MDVRPAIVAKVSTSIPLNIIPLMLIYNEIIASVSRATHEDTQLITPIHYTLLQVGYTCWFTAVLYVSLRRAGVGPGARFHHSIMTCLYYVYYIKIYHCKVS